nr:hypothetical protein [Tanacetum cinerariifolium]
MNTNVGQLHSFQSEMRAKEVGLITGSRLAGVEFRGEIFVVKVVAVMGVEGNMLGQALHLNWNHEVITKTIDYHLFDVVVEFHSQMNKSDLNDVYVNESQVIGNILIDSHESDGEDNQVNDRFKKSERYHAVPSPYIGNYMPPRADLSFAGLDDYVFKFVINETVTSVNEAETSTSKTSKESLEKPKTVRPSAPIIEEWESDSEDENVVEKTERQLNGKREEKPMWNNAGRVNHQNSLRITHPNLKRHMVPRKILTRPIKPNSASITLKRYDYVDARGRSRSVMAWVPRSSGELPTWVMMNPSSMFSGVESTCPTTAIDCFDELTRKIWR